MRLNEWIQDVHNEALQELGRKRPEEIEQDDHLLSEPPHYKLAHLTHGRIRLSVPMIVSHEDLARGMEQRLSEEEGVTSVRSNLWSGSVVVQYDPETTRPDALLRTVDETPLESYLRWRNEPGALVLADPLPGNRRAYILAGNVFVFLGALGIALPVLPGTPLLILAAACYLRGSTRLYNWLVHHPVLGKYVREYYEGKGIPVRAKIYTIAFLWLSTGVSLAMFSGNSYIVGMLLLMSTATTLYLLSMKTLENA